MKNHDARRCLVCGAYGVVALGVRARYENTNAVWAPNLDAYLCEQHARSGCRIEIGFQPATDGRVRVTTDGPRGRVETVLRIGTGIKEAPGQEALL